MARDGEILNKPLIQRMENFLDIGGVRRAPAFLNTDDVKVVYVLGGVIESAPLFSIGKFFPSAVSMQGAATIRWDLCGSLASGASLPLIDNTEFDLELVGIDATVNYTGGGSGTDAGLRMSVSIDRHFGYGSKDPTRVLWIENWQIVTLDVLTYNFNLGTFAPRIAAGAFGPAINPSMNSLYVPRGDRVGITIARQGAGTWPADVNLTLEAFYLTKELQPQTAFSF